LTSLLLGEESWGEMWDGESYWLDVSSTPSHMDGEEGDFNTRADGCSDNVMKSRGTGSHEEAHEPRVSIYYYYYILFFFSESVFPSTVDVSALFPLPQMWKSLKRSGRNNNENSSWVLSTLDLIFQRIVVESKLQSYHWNLLRRQENLEPRERIFLFFTQIMHFILELKRRLASNNIPWTYTFFVLCCCLNWFRLENRLAQGKQRILVG